MLRLVNISEQVGTGVTFQTTEVSTKDDVAYVMYDTSTGITSMQDYYSWRSLTTSTGSTSTFEIAIDNATKYPGTEDDVDDYSLFNPKLFKVMTWAEHEIIQMLLTRIDLIRRRFPNPGVTISDTDGIGQGGVVGFSGGWDKKFSLEELRQMVDGALIEVNIHPPATEHWWAFITEDSDVVNNPYTRTASLGIPTKFIDLIVQGAVLRCLNAWGILEIDLSFSTSDSGLTISYDHVNPIASWMQNILNEYKSQKDFIKWDSVNSMGVGVGTYPFAVSAMWGAAMNMISQGGTIPLSSMLGFGIRANTPM